MHHRLHPRVYQRAFYKLCSHALPTFIPALCLFCNSPLSSLCAGHHAITPSREITSQALPATVCDQAPVSWKAKREAALQDLLQRVKAQSITTGPALDIYTLWREPGVGNLNQLKNWYSAQHRYSQTPHYYRADDFDEALWDITHGIAESTGCFPELHRTLKSDLEFLNSKPSIGRIKSWCSHRGSRMFEVPAYSRWTPEDRDEALRALLDLVKRRVPPEPEACQVVSRESNTPQSAADRWGCCINHVSS